MNTNDNWKRQSHELLKGYFTMKQLFNFFTPFSTILSAGVQSHQQVPSQSQHELIQVTCPHHLQCDHHLHNHLQRDHHHLHNHLKCDHHPCDHLQRNHHLDHHQHL